MSEQTFCKIHEIILTVGWGCPYCRIEALEKEFNIWKTEDYTEKENSKEIAELKLVLKELGEKLIGWQYEKQTTYDKECLATSLRNTFNKLSSEARSK